MRQAARRRQGRDRRFRPGDSQCLAAFRQRQRSGIQFVRPIRIARARRPPRIGHRTGDLQRFLDLGVVTPHLLPIDRPIRPIAEQRARPEPLRPEAQRHHGEVHGAAADRLAAVVAAELDRVLSGRDPVVGPIQLGLLRLVGGKILQRPEPGTGIQPHHGKARLGEPARQGSAAGPRPDDDKVHLVVVAVVSHRHPAAGAEHVGRAAVSPAGRGQRIIRHGGSSGTPLAISPLRTAAASQGSRSS